jgi:hypothetical protein
VRKLISQPTPPLARIPAGGVWQEWFVWMRNEFECLQLENTIDKTVKFLRDNYNELSSESIAEIEQSIRKALKVYDDCCR